MSSNVETSDPTFTNLQIISLIHCAGPSPRHLIWLTRYPRALGWTKHCLPLASLKREVLSFFSRHVSSSVRRQQDHRKIHAEACLKPRPSRPAAISARSTELSSSVRAPSLHSGGSLDTRTSPASAAVHQLAAGQLDHSNIKDKMVAVICVLSGSRNFRLPDIYGFPCWPSVSYCSDHTKLCYSASHRKLRPQHDRTLMDLGRLMQFYTVRLWLWWRVDNRAEDKT
ncbi:hypothetical protein RRG08_015448 [Elysia crispata]|uniref:Uncharacterized protein n=1 Tax=Elysia crispata TaxID=231223 RepID=A0AAE0YH50_9GAST|nr:hypothetical protein RRG08_015448 [Elysia crispata]